MQDDRRCHMIRFRLTSIAFCSVAHENLHGFIEKLQQGAMHLIFIVALQDIVFPAL